ncbi:porin [Hyphomicrobium sp. LHD-15]|uniref:porin n=1 Tax=Hyphomicrobium sp. LHD-15 TaxID=3072142 RepID=UPI00280FD070|nr:porin [Hyphomicrobium sp. LHD-15]MDQ8697189.1 porin [Hyphomicrobium sp. LHD-15]
MNKYSLSALAAAGLLAGGLATSANAADLGGNCCADLEERVAELEATTARKGNRKVSLTVSGWVAEQVTWWDDGVESNSYVTGTGTTLGSNVKFTGQATIVPGWTAGYVLHLEMDGSDALTTNQDRPNGPGLFAGTANYAQTLQSYWFIKSDTFGKVGVGLQSMVADNAAILVDGSGSLVPANWVAFDVLSFGIRAKGVGGRGFVQADRTPGGVLGSTDPDAAFTWGGAGACIPGDCYGVPVNSVRYDSPVFAGFSASASWGDDDAWDIGLRYAGELHGFKVAATVVYAESTGTVSSSFGDSDYTQAGLYIQHIGTGIFGLINYGELDDHVADTDGDTWYFKAGLRRNWNHLGATVLYGEYMNSDKDDSFDSEFKWWGLGAVQEVDAAAMSLWLKYRNYEFEDNVNSYEDLSEVTFGALINF